MSTLLEQREIGIAAALAPVYPALARYAGRSVEDANSNIAGTALAPLSRLVASFGLSSFEREVLLLCAGMEIDPRFAEVLASLPGTIAPVTGLGMTGPDWSESTR